MLHEDLIRNLKSQSTWRLLGLGLITYGVYYAHYIAKQTRIINLQLDEKSQISSDFIISILVLSYLSLALFFGYLLVDEGHPVAVISNVADRLWMLLILIWGFYARNRMNTLNSASSDGPSWFHGLWTFLFSPLYFNYKINVLNSRDHDAHAVA